ncbi:hypothetical protein [Neorhizobium sp. DT-125]|uniref:hypothetical protein n=1 Tax=Neorhizobium sp. DT-125 TaxID=3396163 RepID=UPI003F199898
MNEERRDVSLFIGLHKLAEQNGDGLVPELYALLTARAEAQADMTNVVPFPAGVKSHYSDVPPAEAGRVLAFRR